MERSARRKLGQVVLAVAVGLVGAGSAFAHPSKDEHAEQCRESRRAEALAKYDMNHDGKLDDNERQAMWKAKHEEMLKAFDKDGDGRLSPEERQNMRDTFVRNAFHKADTNGDGKVTREEADASCTPMTGRFDRIDANKDGVITPEELAAAALKRHRHHHRG